MKKPIGDIFLGILFFVSIAYSFLVMGSLMWTWSSINGDFGINQFFAIVILANMILLFLGFYALMKSDKNLKIYAILSYAFPVIILLYKYMTANSDPMLRALEYGYLAMYFGIVGIITIAYIFLRKKPEQQ